MATILVDNRPHEAEDGQNLLQALLSLGYDIPYFCWHPALHSVGACRQCAVKLFADEKDTRGRIVMACMTPADHGARVSVDDPEAVAFRAAVIEWLMMNHPHDCPVCDEGGECHLQDMTVMAGHVRREYRFAKRTFENQDLGPFVNHEMNRCIQCQRCVRFYRDHAGGRDFHVFGARDHLYFGRAGNGTLENEFSGNLVEICPTGVFTDKPARASFTRAWDLSTAPSVCVLCGMGCNTLPGERQGELKRVRNRFHPAINGHFLCDLGRFGHGFVNHERRIRRALVKENGKQEAATPARALSRIREWMARGRLVGIGSPRASLEANFALKALVGPDRFFAGTAGKDLDLLRAVLQVLSHGPARSIAPMEAREADAVLVLGENLPDTAPILALHLRHMKRPEVLARAKKAGVREWNNLGMREVAQGEKGRLFVAAPCPTRMDPMALAIHKAAPRSLARLGFAVAALVDPEAPEAPGLSGPEQEFAESAARALLAAERPLVVSGCGCRSRDVIRAAAQAAWALKARGRDAGLFLAAPEANSLGLALLEPAGGLEDALELLKTGGAGGVVVLENDLFRRMDAASVEEIFHLAPVLALDLLETQTTLRADVVLPAASFAESTGTLVGSEGRAQRFFQVFAPRGDTRESWRWLRDLLAASGRLGDGEWAGLDGLLASLAQASPVLAPARDAAPAASFRMMGGKIPRQGHRYSGRTAMTANVNVHEEKPPEDPDSPLAFSMEGHEGEPPAALIARYWAPGWNSVQALFREEEPTGLRGGGPGARLVEPRGPGNPMGYFTATPTDRAWQIVPLAHLFGSCELSAHVPAIRERAPAPSVALAPGDAAALGLSGGESARVSVNGLSLDLPVRVLPGMPEGVAGLYVGLSGTPFLDLPARGTVTRGERHG